MLPQEETDLSFAEFGGSRRPYTAPARADDRANKTPPAVVTEGVQKTWSARRVRVGVLNERAQIAPAAQVWCRSELPWLAALPDLYRVETQ